MSVQCCINVYPQNTGMRFQRARPCKVSATVERDGKMYCKKHDPVAVKERREKQREEWQRESRIRAYERRMQAAAPALLEALEMAMEHLDMLYPLGVKDGDALLNKIDAAIKQARGE